MAAIQTVNNINIQLTAPLTNAIYAWAAAHIPTIYNAHAVGAGSWEHWAQVEIAMAAQQFCNNNNLLPATVQREAHVFMGNLSVDFAVMVAAPGINLLRHVVELKVEGSVAGNGPAEFVEHMQHDITRLIENRVQLPFVGCTGVAIGISVTPEADRLAQAIFANQGILHRDKPTRFLIPNSTIVVWVYAQVMQ